MSFREGLKTFNCFHSHGSDLTQAVLDLLAGAKGPQTGPIDEDAYARILELEAFGKEKPEYEINKKKIPPKFLTPIQPVENWEGNGAHFEAKVNFFHSFMFFFFLLLLFIHSQF